jgi:ABC-type glycerol-3-phosphate transport system permease component
MFSMFSVQSKPIGQMPRDVYFMEMFGNSLFYAVAMSFFTIATQLMVAYAVAKYKFVGRNLYYNVAIIVMIIPIVGALAAEMQLASDLGLRDSFLGICIMRCKYPGIYFLVFYASFKSISWTYAEAAQIDGAGHLKIFLNLMLPLVSSTITAVFVLQFIANFNDFQTPMMYVPNSPTIAYGLYQYKFNSQTEPTRIIAATMFSCLPIIAIFIVFRNKIMGNVNVGGIKG